MGTGLSYGVPVASTNAQGTVAISAAPALTGSPVALSVTDSRVLPTPSAASAAFKFLYDTNAAYVASPASTTAFAVPFINAATTGMTLALLTSSNFSASAGITGGQLANNTVTSGNVNSTIIIAAGTNPFTGNQDFGTHNITGVGTLNADTVQATTTNGNLTIQPNGTGTQVIVPAGKVFSVDTVQGITTNGNLTIQPNGTGTQVIVPAGKILSVDTVQGTTTNGNLTIQPNGTGTAVAIAVGKTLRLGAIAGAPSGVALQDIYYDSTAKCPTINTDAGTASRIRTTVFTNTASSAAVTANALTDFSLSYTFPAGSLNVLGRVVKIYLEGIYSSGVAQTDVLTLRFDAAAATIASSTITMPTSQTNKGWKAEFTLNTRTTGATGNFVASANSTFFSGAGTVVTDFVTSNGVTISSDLTGARVLHISNTFGAAGNSITIQNMYIEVIG